MGADKLLLPKMMSRRFPIKLIFLGVVVRPLAHKGFDGKILLEQVGELIAVTQLMASQKFSDDVNIHTVVKGDNWKMLCDDSGSISSADVTNTIGNHYSLDPEVVERLELS